MIATLVLSKFTLNCKFQITADTLCMLNFFYISSQRVHPVLSFVFVVCLKQICLWYFVCLSSLKCYLIGFNECCELVDLSSQQHSIFEEVISSELDYHRTAAPSSTIKAPDQCDEDLTHRVEVYTHLAQELDKMMHDQDAFQHSGSETPGKVN